MSISDNAIEQEEAKYDECADQAEQDHLDEMEDEHLHRIGENDNLVDEWLENQADERDEYLFWEDM